MPTTELIKRRHYEDQVGYALPAELLYSKRHNACEN